MLRLSTLILASVLIVPSIACAEDIPRPEHPTPDAVRPHWANLNGTWDFRFDADDQGLKADWTKPDAPGFDKKIVVPFCWESELSGIGKAKDAPKIGWYRRTFEVPKDFPKGDRVWLRFGAVDWRADVWVDGAKVGDHEGGYTPFEFDVTDNLKGDGPHTLVVRAFDPTDPSLPTGKQVGWYTTTSGIWQTVWLESRPKAHIGRFTITTSINPFTLKCRAQILGLKKGDPFELSFIYGDWRRQGFDSRGSVGIAEGEDFETEIEWNFNETNKRLLVPEPWTPDSPNLYEMELCLFRTSGEKGVDFFAEKKPTPIDSIRTYFGLRTIARGKLPGEDFERVLLNGKPIYLRGALDQSFNPKGIYTAPSDEFLKRDIELAKSVGTNFLRIHIKPDEPRRLYWADKLGMLIMEDMPNTWRQNNTARKAWEATMREVVARDRNHPSIFAWVDFNETWGLGSPPEYKKDKDTQAWVKQMVAETRMLDPTRLVEDNSPCNYDHVAGSDLNSWHFYIDDHKSARSHIEDVVKRSVPGSPFNYCPDEKMNTAPLINSEYGSVSAGGGDRDVSWGFRDLTTQLRRHNKIQGYIYTELTDIEWEHNGFFDYNRGKKEFGYDSFVDQMTHKDLQGADFVGYDAPPAIEAKPGELIRVPIFVSHYSDVRGQPKLRWSVKGIDGDGQALEAAPEDVRPVEWAPYTVTAQKPIEFKVPKAFVGALSLALEDSEGNRIAANFVNIVITPETPAPRVERRGDHEAVLRFAPSDFATMKFTDGSDAPLGKVWGRGSGWITYKLKVPASIVKAKPSTFSLMIEAASKGDRKQVDWPERVNAQDNPQTDERTAPSTLDVLLNGQKVERFKLPDDPADARGVLSHLRRIEHGGYGYQFTTNPTRFPASTLDDLNGGKPLVLTFLVFVDAADKNGLTLYGADAGAFPFDPTLVIQTEDDLPGDLGVKPSETVAVDIAAARKVAILRAGDSNGGPPSVWSYTTTDPGASWLEESFDTASWKRGPAGFGTPETPALQDKTIWDTPAIWLKTTVAAPSIGADDTLVLHLFHDEDVAIFVNGKPLFAAEGYVSKYRDIVLGPSAKSLFRAGKNVIAVRCKQTGGGQGIDLGIAVLRGE